MVWLATFVTRLSLGWTWCSPIGQVNPHCRHVVELACVGRLGGPFVVVLVCFHLCETRFTSSVGRFFSMPVAWVSLASRLRAIASKSSSLRFSS